MRTFSLAVCLAVLAFFALGCGYTLLNRMSIRDDPCPPDSNARLPDLEIHVVKSVRHQIAGNTREHLPVNVTTFFFSIHNIGKAPFDGAVQISYADSAKDKSANRYPHSWERRDAFIQMGDSIQFQDTHHEWYSTGVRLRFLLVTDSNCFGCDPICEASYANNSEDYSVP